MKTTLIIENLNPDELDAYNNAIENAGRCAEMDESNEIFMREVACMGEMPGLDKLEGLSLGELSEIMDIINECLMSYAGYTLTFDTFDSIRNDIQKKLIEL